MNRKRLVADYFELTGSETGDVPVPCPFHEDDEPSAQVNFQKRVFNCFAGHCDVNGMSFAKLEEKLDLDSNTESTKIGPSKKSLFKKAATTRADLPVQELFKEELARRGLTKDDVTSLVRLRFDILDGYVSYGSRVTEVWNHQNLGKVDKSNPKYRVDKDGGHVFWLRKALPGDQVWVVEGVWDALCLAQLTQAPVAFTFGVPVSEKQAYELSAYTCFLLFDADAAGYKQARETKKQLNYYGGKGIVVDLPPELSDPADAYREHSDTLVELVTESVASPTSDHDYVARMLEGMDNVPVLPSGIRELDERLGGGWTPGIHVVGAMPGHGKTAFMNDQAGRFASAGLKVHYAAYEPTRPEIWARQASRVDELAWSEIIKNPARVAEETKQYLAALSDNLGTSIGWSGEKVLWAAQYADVLIVDWLQMMPARDDDENASASKNMRILAQGAQKLKLPVLLVSALSRLGYTAKGLKVFKNSGDIEYLAPTATVIKRMLPGTMSFDIRKNRLGQSGKVEIPCKLSHCLYGSEAIQ